MFYNFNTRWLHRLMLRSTASWCQSNKPFLIFPKTVVQNKLECSSLLYLFSLVYEERVRLEPIRVVYLLG
jgi:hypothetical protein